MAPADPARPNEITLRFWPRFIRSWYQGPVAIATDLLVLDVSKSEIRRRMAVVSDYAWYLRPKIYSPDQLAPAKYDGPCAQLNDTLLGSVLPENVYIAIP